MMTGSCLKMRCGRHQRHKYVFLNSSQHKLCCFLCVFQVLHYIRKEFQKHGYSPNDTHHDAMVEDIFKNEDEDKDGFISAREFTYQHDEL